MMIYGILQFVTQNRHSFNLMSRFTYNSRNMSTRVWSFLEYFFMSILKDYDELLVSMCHRPVCRMCYEMKSYNA